MAVGSIAHHMRRSPDPAGSPTDVASMTRRLAERSGRWVLPFWLERQTDPDGPDATSTGDVAVLNVTHRERTPVGTLGSARVATVDPRGLVTPQPGGWSLDWWVGADDRWHLPSREMAVRQSLVDDAPVVETAMRVPGGDVIQRVWAFHDVTVGDVLAVEVENATRVPLALAFAVRPYGPDGAVPLGRIELADRTLRVDGRVAMWLPGDPSRAAASSLADGDVAEVVLRGGAGEERALEVTCTDGQAQAALVVPLAHTAAIRVLLPLDDTTATRGPNVVPPPDAVARGWQTHAGRAARVEIPDAPLAAGFAAARARLLLAAADRSLAAGSTRTTAALVRALDRCGLHDEADAVVATLPEGQGSGARLGGTDTDPAATGAALLAAGHHWRLGRDAGLFDALAGPLAAAAHRRPVAARLGRPAEEPLGPIGSMWQLAGSRAVADGLRATGQPAAADEIDRRGQDLAATVAEVLGPVASARAGTDPVAQLDAVVPLGLVPVDGPAAVAIVEHLRARSLHGPAVLRRGAPFGRSPERTARLAQVELRRGERVALDRVRWLVEAGGSTRTWSDVVHPQHGGGVGGDGWSIDATAAFVELVADLFAVVADDGALALCPVLPDTWLGVGFEVHALPTELGVLSYAVRWHGERPALLWEIEPHADGPSGEVRLVSPGLDPSWSTTDRRGDALLGRPPSAPRPRPASLAVVAEPVVADDDGAPPPDGDSFS